MVSIFAPTFRFLAENHGHGFVSLCTHISSLEDATKLNFASFFAKVIRVQFLANLKDIYDSHAVKRNIVACMHSGPWCVSHTSLVGTVVVVAALADALD